MGVLLRLVYEPRRPAKWTSCRNGGSGRLLGFDIQIRPRANLVRSDRDSVYGIATTASHPELARLYAHARDVLGEVYLPEAVLVQLPSGLWRACLCYICPEMAPRPAELAYVGRIVEAAREFGFPTWYIDRLEKFSRLTAG